MLEPPPRPPLHSARRPRSAPWTVALLVAALAQACGSEDAPAGAGAGPAADGPEVEADSAPGGPRGNASAADTGAARTELPPALRGAFRVVDAGRETHGAVGVPRGIEHVASGLDFVYVPAGGFTFGSTADDVDRFDDERPPRRVRISGFYLAVTETTLEAWRRGGGTGGSAPGDDHPVVGVTWYEARDWCRANGLALPTEAQWEYAASGPRDALYSWGFEPYSKGRANAAGTNDRDRWRETAPVGSFPGGTSWCGAVDLPGNVMEWCRDGWTPDHAAVEDDALDPDLAPEGEAPDVERVVRGASYETDDPHHLRCAYRNALPPTLAGANLGFRPVVPAF